MASGLIVILFGILCWCCRLVALLITVGGYCAGDWLSLFSVELFWLLVAGVVDVVAVVDLIVVDVFVGVFG